MECVERVYKKTNWVHFFFVDFLNKNKNHRTNPDCDNGGYDANGDINNILHKINKNGFKYDYYDDDKDEFDN